MVHRMVIKFETDIMCRRNCDLQTDSEPDMMTEDGDYN